jgi:hypothetical protein
MSLLIKTTDLKSLQIIKNGDEENATSILINNPMPKLLATSDGSLVRILTDAGRLEIIPIALKSSGTLTLGSREDKTHDQISFSEEQDWLLLSNHSNLIVN